MLAGGRLLREGVLQQSSLSENDTYCAPEKQRALLELVLNVHRRCLDLVAAGVPAARIEEVDLSEVIRARDTTPPDGADAVKAIEDEQLARLAEFG